MKLIVGGKVKLKTLTQLLKTGWYLKENNLHNDKEPHFIVERMRQFLGTTVTIKDVTSYRNYNYFYIYMKTRQNIVGVLV